jgi:hypothetical protein
MAQVIEFHVPENFKSANLTPKVTRGKLLQFPTRFNEPALEIARQLPCFPYSWQTPVTGSISTIGIQL